MMKFTINKKDFLDLLNKTQSIVEKRNTMQILSNICLSVKDNTLCIDATDLEVSIRLETDKIHDSKNGEITIYAKNLIDIVREFPETDINFSVQSNQWSQIKAGKIQFQVVSLPSDKFPLMIHDSKKEMFQIPKEKLLNLINKCSFCMSGDETRYFLNGIFFDVSEENYLTTAAMDGFRLASFRQDFTDITSVFNKSFIVPRKGISEIKKILDTAESDPHVSLEDNTFWMKSNNAILSVRLIENDFPNYKTIIPKNYDKKIILEKEPLSSAIKRVSLLANERSKDIKLGFEANRLVISTSNPDVGDAKEEISVTYDGNPVEVRFNSKYILDAISVISSPNVEINITDKLGPSLFKAKDDDQYKAIVMPMRL